MSLEEEVLAEIQPTEEEKREVMRVASRLKEELRRLAEERGIPAEPLLVGSVAKDTFLKGPEIDVFVAFPPGTPRDELERQGLALGNVLDDPKRRFAEHPYTHGRFMGYEADVVPCYKLASPDARMTAVDRTPFHLEYVRDRLGDEQKDQVRLLKQFMKGIGVYGAEARVQGYSGYLCELLVLRYGSFRNVLEAARTWRPGIVLTLDVKPMRKFDEPMVFVDPVDGQRNVASAVSLQALATFVLASKEYLRQPSRKFFFPPPRVERNEEELRQEIQRRGAQIIAVTSTAPDLPEDVLYPQLRKAQHAIETFLKGLDFRVMLSRPYLEKGAWWVLLEMEVHRVPQVKRHRGPPPWMRNVRPFLEKWTSSADVFAGPYLEADHLVVDVKRRFVDALEALRAGLSELSLGKNLDEAIRTGFRVLSGQELIATGRKDLLDDFLRRELPWRV